MIEKPTSIVGSNIHFQGCRPSPLYSVTVYITVDGRKLKVDITGGDSFRTAIFSVRYVEPLVLLSDLAFKLLTPCIFGYNFQQQMPVK